MFYSNGYYFTSPIVWGYINQIISLVFLCYCSIYVIKKENLKLQEVKVETVFLDELERVRTFSDKIN